jgi:DNA-binding transcriptional MerR regulator
MSEIRYIISDASKRLKVEPHVLRYWEEELELEVPRNELGHRYYREEDLKALENIKVLKEQGFQLKAIKMLLPNLDQMGDITEDNIPEELRAYRDHIIDEEEEEYHNVAMSQSNVAHTESKFRQFQVMMQDMFESALKENNNQLTENVSETIIKQMDYLLRIKEEREEERFKKLDEIIRETQKARQEVAITKNKKNKFFLRLIKNNKTRH